MNREQVQSTALELSKVYNNLILEWCTGLGKTLAAIKIIEARLHNSSPWQMGEDWYIVIAETNHEYTWRSEFRKHGKEHLLAKVTFLCYHSLHKYISGTHYIFDMNLSN